jgi:seryl-tRNA synthetase
MAVSGEAVRVKRHEFRDQLIRHGILIGRDSTGICGHSAEFEQTVERIDRLVTAVGAADRPDVMRFSPLLNRSDFERSGYLECFPHLAGSIHSFTGNERDHRELLQTVRQGGNWGATLTPTGSVLAPAACYPVYPALSGTIQAGGRLVDVMSYCFRHEPSDDPGRLQMFRMHEHVRLAEPASTLAWRQTWVSRVETLTGALGLEARSIVASDAFFGRSGELLAENQRAQRLKFEIVTPIASAEQPTAIISLNYHQDHFGQLFGIRTENGAFAHTACVGFGLERIALALYRQHGFSRSTWPRFVREALGL